MIFAAAALSIAASLSAGLRGAPDLRPPPLELHAGVTHCGACHSTDGWHDVSFAHDRTGFPLRGAHRQVRCKECHAGGFSRPVSHACTACHRDVHRGQLGIHCQGCHGEDSWRSRFDADAHRRVGFPLTGRHAFIPCAECHGNQLNRGFARPASGCYDCHQQDYARTAQTGFVDHAKWGLGTDCKECHVPWRFTGGSFPAHQRCFDIASGPHAGIPCGSCHTAPPTGAIPGQCQTNNAACTRCHTCSATDPVHATVLGYQCADRKCYECHRFAASVVGGSFR